MKSPFKFAQYGQSGTWASEIFPNLSTHVDDMAMMYSCYTHTNNHSPALFEINTGMSRMGFPCVGSWVTYGLGYREPEPPGLRGDVRHPGPGRPEGARVELGRGVPAGRLPGHGAECPGFADGQPRRGAGRTDSEQRAQIDLINRLNKRHREQHAHEADLAARIESFELAYRMQMAAPEALDVNREPEPIRKLYGIDDPRCSHFAKQCLMARRLVERGVRFVQIYSGGMENERSWDGHTDIAKNHSGFAGETDKPIAALLSDLKASGLLDSTLVIWNGEFGRLPIVQKGGHRPRPQPPRLHDLDGRRRRQGRGTPRQDRRDRPQGGRGQGQRERPPRHHPAPARDRPRAPDLPIPGPRLPPDRTSPAGWSGTSWP